MTNHPPAPPTSPPGNPIPVICDLCRAHGQSGDDPFEQFGALLDFEPVPRRSTRANGWDPEVQRAYIAALSLTGSRRAACRAVGRSDFGVNQLLACPGSEGFRAAHDEAMAIAADERSRRLAEGLRTVAAEQSGWRPPDPPWAKAAGARRGRPAGPTMHGKGFAQEPAPSDPDEPSPEMVRMLDTVFTQYLHKVEAERKSRLEGRIVEADFYVRQLTMIEVGLDLLSGDGFKLLNDFRIDRRYLVEIAQTPFSKMLGDIRREQWVAMGDPPRPEHPPADHLVDHGRYQTEPGEPERGGSREAVEQQRREREERERQEAEAQLRWEAEARQDYERRRSTEGKPDDA